MVVIVWNTVFGTRFSRWSRLGRQRRMLIGFFFFYQTRNILILQPIRSVSSIFRPNVESHSTRDRSSKCPGRCSLVRYSTRSNSILGRKENPLHDVEFSPSTVRRRSRCRAKTTNVACKSLACTANVSRFLSVKSGPRFVNPRRFRFLVVLSSSVLDANAVGYRSFRTCGLQRPIRYRVNRPLHLIRFGQSRRPNRNVGPPCIAPSDEYPIGLYSALFTVSCLFQRVFPSRPTKAVSTDTSHSAVACRFGLDRRTASVSGGSGG